MPWTVSSLASGISFTTAILYTPGDFIDIITASGV
jgi:hypothetical protein